MPKHEPEVLAAIRRRQPFNSQVVLDNTFSEARQTPRCPRCGGPYLHCASSHDIGGDTHIPFSCDSCSSEFELVVVECKGNNVLIEWREP
jgi:hypothetical protein